jgi:hypothetical protein
LLSLNLDSTIYLLFEFKYITYWVKEKYLNTNCIIFFFIINVFKIDDDSQDDLFGNIILEIEYNFDSIFLKNKLYFIQLYFKKSNLKIHK